jgi:Trk K+ transport system NAD-binding subunit
VFLTKSDGILIIGASKFSRLIGHYLEENNRSVVMIDNNQSNVNSAKELGLEAMNANIYSDTLTDNIELNDVGYLMAMTGNSDINKYTIERFSKTFGEHGSYRLVTADEMSDDTNNPKEGLFSHTDDYIQLSEVARNYPAIHEIEINSKEQYNSLIDLAVKDANVIPLFIKSDQGELEIISSFSKDKNIIKEGYKLVYLGKHLDIEKVNNESNHSTSEQP